MADSAAEQLEAAVAQAVFVVGPARGGTTIMTRILAEAQQLVAVGGSGETWELDALYSYDARAGIAADLWGGEVVPEHLLRRLTAAVRKRDILGRAALGPVLGSAPGGMPTPRGLVRRLLGVGQATRMLPLLRLGAGDRLLLKSPELCFGYDVLARSLPRAAFVVTYRPVEAVIASMWHKGRAGWYWAGWRRRDVRGDRSRPPTVGDVWARAWRCASDLQRCAIRAVSYFEALLPRLDAVPGERLARVPHRLLLDDFAEAVARIRRVVPSLRAAELERGRRLLRRTARGLSPTERREIDKNPEIAAGVAAIEAQLSSVEP